MNLSTTVRAQDMNSHCAMSSMRMVRAFLVHQRCLFYALHKIEVFRYFLGSLVWQNQIPLASGFRHQVGP